jgi:hypothetical protein
VVHGQDGHRAGAQDADVTQTIRREDIRHEDIRREDVGDGGATRT